MRAEQTTNLLKSSQNSNWQDSTGTKKPFRLSVPTCHEVLVARVGIDSDFVGTHSQNFVDACLPGKNAFPAGLSKSHQSLRTGVITNLRRSR
jgi:hypothetical protein